MPLQELMRVATIAALSGIGLQFASPALAKTYRNEEYRLEIAAPRIGCRRRV